MYTALRESRKNSKINRPKTSRPDIMVDGTKTFNLNDGEITHDGQLTNRPETHGPYLSAESPKTRRAKVPEAFIIVS
jgi:hypothetical protein